MVWYLVIYMFMVLSSVLPTEVFVFLTPGPIQAYHCTNEGREAKGCLWNHNPGLCSAIHVGTALWPPQWFSEQIHTLTRAESPPFTFLSDHRHRYALNVSSPVRKHESQSWHSTCPKCLQDGMKWIYRHLGQQTTKRKLTLTRGLNRQNVNVEWKYKTDTNSKHTFGDMTYHLPGTSLFYLRTVQTAFVSFGENAASLTSLT